MPKTRIKIIRLLLLWVLLPPIVACSINEKCDIDVPSHNAQSSSGSTSHCVSLSDVQRLFGAPPIINTKSKTIPEIYPMLFDGDTTLYVVNKPEGGWMIISGDKRTPSIVAMGEESFFDVKALNPNIRKWLDYICCSIHDLRGSAYTNKKNESLWNENVIPMTKGGDENVDTWTQLVYTIQEFDVSEDIGHLTSTNWGQNDPWNQCAPWYDSSRRCSTGCSATAVAQMSYFLHFHLGRPLYTYDSGYGVGWVGNYSLVTSSTSSTVWEDMPTSFSESQIYGYNTNAVATLMASIADYFHASWGVPTSVNDIYFNVNNYYSQYGVSCSSSWYNSDIVDDNIRRGLPVIINAQDSYNIFGGGHCWIIDGLKVVRLKSTYIYKEMPRGEYPPVEPEEPDWDHLEDYIVSDPIYSDCWQYYRMNWGWNGAYNNDLFLMDGDWIVSSEATEGQAAVSYNLTSLRRIFHDFEILN